MALGLPASFVPFGGFYLPLESLVSSLCKYRTVERWLIFSSRYPLSPTAVSSGYSEKVRAFSQVISPSSRNNNNNNNPHVLCNCCLLSLCCVCVTYWWDLRATLFFVLLFLFNKWRAKAHSSLVIYLRPYSTWPRWDWNSSLTDLKFCFFF